MKAIHAFQNIHNQVHAMVPVKRHRLKSDIRHFSYAFMLCAALFTGYTFAQKTHSSTRETAIAEQPIINKDAVNDYKNGKISRELATQRIEGQLNQLKDFEYIRDWEYEDASQEYVITLKNDALFGYKLH